MAHKKKVVIKKQIPKKFVSYAQQIKELKKKLAKISI